VGNTIPNIYIKYCFL